MKGSGNAQPRNAVRLLSHNVFSGESDLSRIRLEHSCNCIEEGRLSRAVGPDQPNNFSFAEAETELVYRDEAAEGSSYFAEFEQREILI